MVIYAIMVLVSACIVTAGACGISHTRPRLVAENGPSDSRGGIAPGLHHAWPNRGRNRGQMEANKWWLNGKTNRCRAAVTRLAGHRDISYIGVNYASGSNEPRDYPACSPAIVPAACLIRTGSAVP